MVEPITTSAIMLAIISFLVGVLVGWVISNHISLSPRGTLKTMIAVVITLGWLTATISGILLASYTVSPLVHGLMGAIVGYFFTDDGISFNIGRGND